MPVPVSRPGSARITVSQRGDVTRIEVVGDLDQTAAPAVWDLVGAAIEEGTGEVQLSLAQATFVDSIGLRMVIQASREAAARERPFRLVDVAEQPRRLLELVGLDTLLDGDAPAGGAAGT